MSTATFDTKVKRERQRKTVENEDGKRSGKNDENKVENDRKLRSGGTQNEALDPLGPPPASEVASCLLITSSQCQFLKPKVPQRVP